MRNRVEPYWRQAFRSETLNGRLIAAGWEGLKDKEISFFFG